MQAFQRVINCGVWLFQVSYKVTLFTFFNIFLLLLGWLLKSEYLCQYTSTKCDKQQARLFSKPSNL